MSTNTSNTNHIDSEDSDNSDSNITTPDQPRAQTVNLQHAYDLSSRLSQREIDAIYAAEYGTLHHHHTQTHTHRPP